MTRTADGKTGSSRKESRVSRESVLDVLEVPSPPPKPRGGVPGFSPAHTNAQVDLQQVLELAQYGLSAAEIMAQLNATEPLSTLEEPGVLEVIRRGRALGRAAIKKARYAAALEGRVTAQQACLRGLSAEPEEEPNPAEGVPPALTVRRTILEPMPEPDQTVPDPDSH